MRTLNNLLLQAHPGACRATACRWRSCTTFALPQNVTYWFFGSATVLRASSPSEPGGSNRPVRGEGTATHSHKARPLENGRGLLALLQGRSRGGNRGGPSLSGKVLSKILSTAPLLSLVPPTRYSELWDERRLGRAGDRVDASGCTLGTANWNKGGVCSEDLKLGN